MSESSNMISQNSESAETAAPWGAYRDVPVREKPVFDANDSFFAAAMLLCGFLWWHLIMMVQMPGIGVTLFALMLFTLSWIYLSASGLKQNRRSLTTLALAAVVASWFIFFDNDLLGVLNLMLLAALYVYWVSQTSGRRLDPGISIYTIGDAIRHALVVPFANIATAPAALGKLPQKSNMKNVALAVGGIIVALPLLAIVVSLLVSADAAFESFTRQIAQSLRLESFSKYFWQFILGIPIAFYLFGLLYGNIKDRFTDRLTKSSVDEGAERLRFAPCAAAYSALVAFNIIYLVFFGVQAVYLFSAFKGTLPEAFTYAEYARRGFFELCGVAGINLFILAVAHLVTKHDETRAPLMLRVLTLITTLFTLLLLATALSKMVMYIDAYGLTLLRVYTSWFMVLLLFVFIVVAIRQFTKFNATRWIIVGFLVLFFALSFSNVDGLIARYNIDRFRAGTLPKIDVEAMNELSDAAIPELYRLSQDEGDSTRHDNLVKAMLVRGYRSNEDLRAFNYQRYRANLIRDKIDPGGAVRDELFGAAD